MYIFNEVKPNIKYKAQPAVCDKCNTTIFIKNELLETIDENMLILKDGAIAKCRHCGNTQLSEEPILLKETINTQSNQEVHCRKCNSTQIQLVPKRWSLLTGFLTSKIDRVCLNCKNKF